MPLKHKHSCVITITRAKASNEVITHSLSPSTFWSMSSMSFIERIEYRKWVGIKNEIP